VVIVERDRSSSRFILGSPKGLRLRWMKREISMMLSPVRTCIREEERSMAALSSQVPTYAIHFHKFIRLNMPAQYG
jgi:hypothetical protein